MEQELIDRGDFLPEETEPVVEEVVEEVAEEAEQVVEESPPRDEKGKFVPKGRFDEAIDKERAAREAAERRAQELEHMLQQRQQYQAKTEQTEELEAKIAEMEKQHALLLLDGEGDKAAELMRSIRHTERQIARAEAQADARVTTNQILEAERFELSVAKLEADYPELNPKSENYDRELVEMILDRQSRLVQNGTSPSKAIVEATDFVMRRAAKQGGEPQQGLAAAKAPDRKTAQVAKNLEVRDKQPPSMKDVGMDSDKAGEKALPPISQMSLEEFDALPAATKARLRGDTL
jgi:hypothetical protein